MIKKIKITNMNTGFSSGSNILSTSDFHFKVVCDILNETEEFKKLGLSCKYDYELSGSPWGRLYFYYNDKCIMYIFRRFYDAKTAVILNVAGSSTVESMLNNIDSVSMNYYTNYKAISEIYFTSNAVSFTMIDPDNKSKYSKGSIIISKTKNDSMAIICNKYNPGKISTSNGYVNDIYCVSLNSLTNYVLPYKISEISKSSMMSFDPVPVCGDDDIVKNCYFTLNSPIETPCIINAQGKNWLYNGIFALQE